MPSAMMGDGFGGHPYGSDAGIARERMSVLADFEPSGRLGPREGEANARGGRAATGIVAIGFASGRSNLYERGPGKAF